MTTPNGPDEADPTTSARVGWRQRGPALASLACGAMVAVVTVVFVVDGLGRLALGLVGLAVTVAGGWWMITERMPRRAVGVAGVVIGVVAMALAVARAVSAGDHPVLRLALLGALVVATAALARAALVADLRERDRRRPMAVTRPQHPVLICNPWSGGGKVEKFGLVALAEEMGVEVVMLDHGLDLEKLARDAVARGADCLGMAGGDGSQALVASIAIEHDLPFVVVSAGTRNHFALDLGIDREDPRLSLDAFRDGIERRIDYATVGDRLFVNNVSLGIYATIVQQEGYRDAKSETTKALLPEMLGPHRGALRPAVHRARRQRGRRRVPHPGLEQPLRAGRHPRRLPTTTRRHRDAGRRRHHRRHRLGGRRRRRHVRARPAPPEPLLARVHHRRVRGPVPVRGKPSPASTAKPSSSTPPSISGSTPAACDSSSRPGTSPPPRSAEPATSRPATCSTWPAAGAPLPKGTHDLTHAPAGATAPSIRR